MKTLVFAGGNGTRLWPISRIKSPKQFQKLINDKSLFELTIDRLLKKFELDDIYVVIPQIYYDSVKSFYPNIKDENIIIEPFKWDTLSCIGYAAFVLSKKFPNENVFITWSDGYIEDEEKFMEMITVGDSYATQNNKIIRIGAKVTFPSVNLGYIQISDELKRVNDVKVYQYVHQFEKPELEIAKKFFASSDYLWNTGYMIWPLDKLIDAYRMHSPISFEILEKIADPGFLGSIEEEYKKIPKTSIDFEILENIESNDSVVIPVDMGWNDLGDWNSLKTQFEKNEGDNVVTGSLKKTHFINSENNILYSHDSNKTVCVIGLDNIAIVDTPDAILICHKDLSKDVKKMVEILQDKDPSLC